MALHACGPAWLLRVASEFPETAIKHEWSFLLATSLFYFVDRMATVLQSASPTVGFLKYAQRIISSNANIIRQMQQNPYFRGLVRATGKLLLPLGVVSILIWRFQRKLIFAPPTRTSLVSLWNMQLVRVNTGSRSAGPSVALYAPAKSPTAPTLVYFHGNADQLGWSPLQIAHHFVRRGCGFFAVEFPGYGYAKSGKPSERNCYCVAEAALRHLVADEPYGLGVSKENVVLLGQSLGTGIAVEMSTRGFGNRMVWRCFVL